LGLKYPEKISVVPFSEYEYLEAVPEDTFYEMHLSKAKENSLTLFQRMEVILCV